MTKFKKKVLITGASGFIGSVLTTRLEGLWYNVIPFSHNEQFFNYKNYVVGDLLDKKQINGLIGDVKPNVVFHLAADKFRCSTGIDFLRNSLDVNFIGTLNLVEACLHAGSVEHFIFLGTCEEYGDSTIPYFENQRENPISVYGFSKMVATHVLQNMFRINKFPITILRPSIAYGPGQGTDMFLAGLIKSLINNEYFDMSDGGQMRDFIYVDDIVDACLLTLGNNSAIGRVVNIGSGKSMPLREIAILTAKIVGDSSVDLIRFGSLPYRNGEIMNYSVDISLARSMLGWSPRTSLEKGLKTTVESFI